MPMPMCKAFLSLIGHSCIDAAAARVWPWHLGLYADEGVAVLVATVHLATGKDRTSVLPDIQFTKNATNMKMQKEKVHKK